MTSVIYRFRDTPPYYNFIYLHTHTCVFIVKKDLLSTYDSCLTS